MLKFRLIGGILTLIIGTLLLSACGGGISQDLAMTLTAIPNDISTQAVATFSSNLTLTALAAPTNTPAPTATALPTATPFATLASLGTAPVAGATASCYGLSFVSDVTIPDNTPVDAGKKFTKTWKVQNSGTCAWDAGFKFSFVTGDDMGGVTYVLPAAVAAGAVSNISVEMTAPDKAGTARSDWRMSTAGGQFFGDQVYVQVVVGGGAGATATNTSTSGGSAATATSTSTPTPTPTK